MRRVLLFALLLSLITLFDWPFELFIYMGVAFILTYYQPDNYSGHYTLGSMGPM
jgi:hypothetical protein